MNFWRDEPPLPRRISLISRRTWNGGNGEECRVVIEGGRVGVWVAEGRTVRQVDNAEIESVERNGRGWMVFLPDVAWDVAQGGCGCGSPLKHHEPTLVDPDDLMPVDENLIGTSIVPGGAADVG